MAEENSNDSQMNDPLEQLLREALPDQLVTNFIIIAEVASGSQQELSLSVSDSMTPWLAHGMLELAMDMMRSGEYGFPITEENNGQEH
jgi:hypothetical protein